MKKLSVKKFSIVGLLLMGASAVTAAFIPSSEKAEQNSRAAGFLILSTAGNVFTCTAGEGEGDECNATTASGTTGVGVDGTLTTLRDGITADTTANTTLNEA